MTVETEIRSQIRAAVDAAHEALLVRLDEIMPPPPPFVILNPADHLLGANLAGLEFEGATFPGVHGVNYFNVSPLEVAYYLQHGVDHFRIPFKWERAQLELFCPLENGYLNHLITAVSAINAGGGAAILDIHNYGGRHINGVNFKIDSAEVPRAAYLDFLTKLVIVFDGMPGILGWDHNEPNGLPGGAEQWKDIMQASIDAMRAAGEQRWIFVAGYFFNKHIDWSARNPTLHQLVDPLNRLVASTHAYSDHNTSGTYDGNYAAEKASDGLTFHAIQDFLGWCELHNWRGHVGECGTPGNHAVDGPKWRTVVDAMAQECLLRGVMVTLWGSGRAWPESYALKVTPEGNFKAGALPVDKPNTTLLFDLAGRPGSTLADIEWQIAVDKAEAVEGEVLSYSVSWSGGAIRQGESVVLSFVEGGTAGPGDFDDELGDKLDLVSLSQDDGLIYKDGRLYVHSRVLSPIVFQRQLAIDAVPGENVYSLAVTPNVGASAGPASTIIAKSDLGFVQLVVPLTSGAADGRQRISSAAQPVTEPSVSIASDIYVGLCFEGVAVPPSKTVLSAVIQVAASANGADTASFSIAAFDQGNTGLLDAGSIKARPVTTAAATWEPPAFVTGQIYETPDLASLVQAVVNRADWLDGNVMGFRIARTTGTRSVAMFEHTTLPPATLVLRYAPT